MSATLDSDRRYQAAALFATLLISALLVVLCLFWIVFRGQNPPPDEEKFEVVGRMDFGNFTEGSMNVNNRQAPSPMPSDAADKPTPSKTEAAVPETPIVQETENVVKAPPTPPQQAKPAPAPAPKPSPAASQSGGSNHGRSRGVGDRGRPDSPYLDPNGLFAFGSGGEGLGGRSVLKAPPPVYDAQEEGKMTFLLTIAPNGHVVQCKPKFAGGQYKLKKAVTDCVLAKWLFSPVEGSGNQVVTVTFNFNLR